MPIKLTRPVVRVAMKGTGHKSEAMLLKALAKAASHHSLVEPTTYVICSPNIISERVHQAIHHR